MTDGGRKAVAAVPWFLSAVIFVRKLAVPLYDPDLWWHLAAGREMVRRRAWLRTDVFSHSLGGTPWIDFEWLAQLLIYGVHRMGGLWALYGAKIFFSLTALGLLVATIRRSGARGPALLAGAWAAFLLLRPRLFDRTELATLNLLPLSILLVQAARSSPRVRRFLPQALAGVMVLWVNFHGGFLYGLAVLAAFAVGARWAGEEAGFIGSLDSAFTWSLAATLVNPYGPEISHIFAEVFVGMKSGLTTIEEWGPPLVEAVPAFWFFFLAGGAALARGILKGSREARFWAPAVVGLAVAGAGSYRNTVLFAFTVLPFLAGESASLRPPFRKALWVAAGGLVLLNAGALVRPFPRVPVFSEKLPAGACRFVAEKGVHGKLFNVYDEGGYLEWALGPERKVLMDGRYLFLPLLMEERGVSETALAGGDGAGAWNRFMEKYGIDYAVTKPALPGVSFRGRAPFPLRMTNLMFPRDRWALVYWDDAGMVFLRRKDGFDALIEKHEYRWLWPYNLDQMRYAAETGKVPRAAFSAELDRHASETGPTVLEREMRDLLAGGKRGVS